MRRIIPILIAAVWFASCANPDKVKLSGPVSVDVESASRVEVGCMVENCSAHRIKLLSARVTLHYATERLATVLLASPVEIGGCSSGFVQFPLRFRFANPLTALSAADLEALDWENLYITGEGVVRSGVGRKKIRLRDYPVREFITTFNADIK